MEHVRIVDSHTAGEPTRVVVAGGPELGAGPLADRRRAFAADWAGFRCAVVCEPRGSDVLVGALLCPPAEPGCAAGVIFFNNVGTLGMCGHGTIGVMVTLAHLGRLGPGRHRLDTPVGPVEAELHGDGAVTVTNVPSYRHAAGVAVQVPGYGGLRGDVAWGGNWFFLTAEHGRELVPTAIPALTDLCRAVRRALQAAGITGAGGAGIDHIELLGPGRDGAHGRSFVLCPGDAYDRSPCGTGTSAKLACLAADGLLAPGEPWVAESILGTRFSASYAPGGAGGLGMRGAIVPRITGRAHVTLEGTLLLAADDPFRFGLPGA